MTHDPTNFRVWAPRPSHVELCIHDQRLPMQRGERGWWTLHVPEAKHGDEYAFSLDGGPSRPDPRSMDQPHGVHGPSRLVDHGAYRWKCESFRACPLGDAVIYELHIGAFTDEGTFDAAIGRLDHLVDLGVTHVEVMPINAFDGQRGWGYDGVCWFAPHRPYTGADGPDAVKRFVDACHERGLAVLLDVVYNHLGPSGNYLDEFGEYFTDSYTTPWGKAINLDGAGSDEVRRLICDSAMMWLREYRFDGLRLDAVHAFHDRSAVHLLEQLAEEVSRLERESGRSLTLIAESDLNDPRIIRSPDAGGYGIDAQWSDDFHHALHAVLTGERDGYYVDFGRMEHLAQAWERAFVYDGRYSEFRQRRHGRPPTGLSGSRFLAYAQNHDQVGNRAKGDRLSILVDAKALEVAAAAVLLSPFVPMLFQGEEWGTQRSFLYFTDHRDGLLADAVRRGRREEFAAFGWDPHEIPDPQAEETFARSKLDWRELEQPNHAALLEWHRRLIALRRAHVELSCGPLEEAGVEFSEEARWLVVRRGSMRLTFNFGAQRIRAPLKRDAGEQTGAGWELLLTNDSSPEIDDEAVALGPYGVAVLRLE